MDRRYERDLVAYVRGQQLLLQCEKEELINREEQEEIERFRQEHPGQKKVFAYVHSYMVRPALEVVVVDPDTEEPYHSFIITEMTRMSREKEKLFDKYCHDPFLQMDRERREEIYAHFQDKAWELHLNPYENVMFFFHHLYYAQQAGAIEELLYRAELDVFARNWKSLRDVNLIGTTPSEILDMPVKAVRACNREWGIRLLLTGGMRRRMTAFYGKYPKYFYRLDLSPCMRRYVKEVLLRRPEERLGQDDREILNYFCSEELDMQTYDKCMEYWCIRDTIRNLYHLPLLPEEEEDWEELFEKADFILFYLVSARGYVDYCMEKRYYLMWRQLEWECGPYRTFIPKSVEDVLRLSDRMHNCLWTYLDRLGRSDTVIVALERIEGDEEDEADAGEWEAVLEISGGEIVQASQRFCMELNEIQKDWIEAFAERNRLIAPRRNRQ